MKKLQNALENRFCKIQYKLIYLKQTFKEYEKEKYKTMDFFF